MEIAKEAAVQLSLFISECAEDSKHPSNYVEYYLGIITLFTKCDLGSSEEVKTAVADTFKYLCPIQKDLEKRDADEEFNADVKLKQVTWNVQAHNGRRWSKRETPPCLLMTYYLVNYRAKIKAHEVKEAKKRKCEDEAADPVLVCV